MKPRLRLLLTILLLLVPLLLIISPNLTYVMVFEGSSWKKSLGRTIYFIFLFLMPLGLFQKKPRWYFYLISPLFLLSLVVNYLYLHLNTTIKPEVIMVMLDSNASESSEFITSVPVYCWLLAILASVLYFTCLGQLPKKISARSAWATSAICGLLFFSFPALRYGSANYAENLYESTMYFFPFNIITHGRYALSKESSFRAFNSNTKNFSFAATKKPLKEKEIHVLVIGESSRRDHWELYGYSRSTSPLLKARKLLVFSDATSAGYLTNMVVPIMLTRATASNLDLHLREKGLVHAFREAQFETYWINSQAGADSIYIHANEGNHYLSASIATEGELPKLLLTLLAKEKKEKVFLVFHTSGSHWRYDLRYPDSFNIFKPSLKDQYGTDSDRSKLNLIVNAYDNTVLYTDYVLDGLIKILESMKSVSSLTYISDHGENLLDDERGLSLHNEASKFTTGVPLLIWTSNSYQATYPEKIRALSLNKNKKISTENIFYSVLDLADIKLRDGFSNRSFADKSFTEHERFILTNDGLKPYIEVK